MSTPSAVRRDPTTLEGATFDWIVCGAGSAGSVVAARLAEDQHARVLLVEAGGDEDVSEVQDPYLWFTNLTSDRVWPFRTEPDPTLEGRRLDYAMGRVLGGGGSVNVSVWARGHQDDWNSFADATGDPGWGYDSVLDVYRRVEDWQGAPDPHRRGSSGPMWVQTPPEPEPLYEALVEGAAAVGLPRFDSANGVLMESEAGTSLRDEVIHDDRRRSPYRSYVLGADHPNLVVVTGTVVDRVRVQGGRAVGVDLRHEGRTIPVAAEREVVLALGGVGTPAALLRSGIGDADHLVELGVPLVAHLPGVGQNLHDHLRLITLWSVPDDVPLPAPGISQSMSMWSTEPGEDGQRTAVVQYADTGPVVSADVAARYSLPPHCVALQTGLRLRGRGRITLTTRDPHAAPRISTRFLTGQDDLRAAVETLELNRAIMASAPLAPFRFREAVPGPLDAHDTERFVRLDLETLWHQCGTARMGRDDHSVVGADLRVHGVQGLRVADASVLPQVTVTNTMAPSVVVGERAVTFLRAAVS